LSAEDGKCDMGIVRPAHWWLKQVLGGHIHMDDAPLSVQSWARLPIFEGAKEIVLMDTKQERAAELLKVPPRVRGYVEREVVRLWPLRASL